MKKVPLATQDAMDPTEFLELMALRDRRVAQDRQASLALREQMVMTVMTVLVEPTVSPERTVSRALPVILELLVPPAKVESKEIQENKAILVKLVQQVDSAFRPLHARPSVQLVPEFSFVGCPQVRRVLSD